jgi:hypothetical protein
MLEWKSRLVILLALAAVLAAALGSFLPIGVHNYGW